MEHNGREAKEALRRSRPATCAKCSKTACSDMSTIEATPKQFHDAVAEGDPAAAGAT